MASTILLKRGLKANLPAEAALGEPLYCTDTGEIFVGMGAGQSLKSTGVIIDDVTASLLTTFSSSKINTLLGGKQDSLGYTAENTVNKGSANGYAGLDANGKVPLSQIPDTARQQTYVVLNTTTRTALEDLISGDKAFETSTGDSYIWDGSQWFLVADADWANVNLSWANISDKPTTFAPSAHNHASTEITDFVEAAQDAIGGILTDSTSIDFTYDDTANTISAVAKVDDSTIKIGASGLYVNAIDGGTF